MKMSPFFVQLGRIVVGYVAASAVIVLFYLLAFSVIDKSMNYKDQLVHVQLAYGFTSIIVMFALPLLIVTSEWRRVHKWFAQVGAIVAIGGLMLFIVTTGITSTSLFVLTFGCAPTGLTYWAIAGRHAGKWRADAAAPSK